MVIAHVKWFIEETNEVSPFSFYETSVWVWLIIGMSLVLVAGLLDFYMKGPNEKWINWVKKTKSKWIYFLQLAIAASLIFASANQVILVPHYEASSLFLPIVEVLAAFFLILNRWVWMGTFLLFFSYLASAISFGFLEVADYINVLGMVIFLYLEKPFNNHWKRWRHRSLDFLRVLTGTALVILAFTEKLLAPEKALSFLADYDVNFMRTLGFDYSDRLFVLSAGSMELVFGLIMILGFIPRVNTAALAVFLISSNIFFFIQGYGTEGVVEIMGHLPIIASAVLIVLYGKSFKTLKTK